MTIPGESHEGIGNEEEENGQKGFHVKGEISFYKTRTGAMESQISGCKTLRNPTKTEFQPYRAIFQLETYLNLPDIR